MFAETMFPSNKQNINCARIHYFLLYASGVSSFSLALGHLVPLKIPTLFKIFLQNIKAYGTNSIAI